MLNRFLKLDTVDVDPFRGVLQHKQGVGLVDKRNQHPVSLNFEAFELWITVPICGSSLKYRAAVLIALSTRNCRLAWHQWSKVRILYVDGNPANLDPQNLIPIYPREGLEDPAIPGFREIPGGFSQYLISPTGEVYSRHIQREISSYTDNAGYRMVGLTPDVGKRGIYPVHRLLALAYLPYSASVSKHDVNHKNGEKWVNELSNLEWVSRKGNCDHAYSTGLRTDNIKVKVRNIFTGYVKEFYSIEDCARNLDLDGQTIAYRLAFDGQKVYPPGLQLQRSTSDTPWKEVNNPMEAVLQSGLPLNILARNRKTNTFMNFRTLTDCAEFCGVCDATLKLKLNRSITAVSVKDCDVWYPNFENLSKSILGEIPG